MTKVQAMEFPSTGDGALTIVPEKEVHAVLRDVRQFVRLGCPSRTIRLSRLVQILFVFRR